MSEEKKPKLSKEGFKKLAGIFRYVLPYKWVFAGGLFLLVLSSSMMMAFPFVTGKLIDMATGNSDWFISNINQAAGLLLGVFLVQALFSFFRVMLFAQVSERVLADIRMDLYSKLMSLPMVFYDKNRSGELISRMTNDISVLHSTVSVTLAELLRQIVVLAVGITMIFVLTPTLSVFMLATFPVVVIAAFFFGKYIRKLSKKTQDELAKTNVIVEETIQAISTVKSFTSEFFETLRYKKSMDTVVDTALKAARFRAGFISFMIFAIFGAIVAIMWFGATLVQSGEMTVGELLSFVLYTTFIGGSIAGLGDLFGQFQRAIGSSERVLEILHEPGELNSNNIIASKKLTGSIEYHQVHFQYPTRSEIDVIRGVDLTIREGQKIALVGPSGAGKSTMVQLLMKFYSPTSGAITIGGQDIAEMPVTELRQSIGIVPQEVILFGGSIEENIRYGKPDASVDEIVAAARKANAWEFIEKFPEGLATVVGERGVKLSGGQRQRIAIARAILKDPAILVLDEATSSLDSESEHLVQDALSELMKKRTTIIIAHRLSTIRAVDQIYVLVNGEIAEAGKHDELMLQGGTYARLTQLQMLEVE
jgi:ABC transporter fused permease/ATP-binding protein